VAGRRTKWLVIGLWIVLLAAVGAHALGEQRAPEEPAPEPAAAG
jgi:hypothetical protein